MTYWFGKNPQYASGQSTLPTKPQNAMRPWPDSTNFFFLNFINKDHNIQYKDHNVQWTVYRWNREQKSQGYSVLYKNFVEGANIHSLNSLLIRRIIKWFKINFHFLLKYNKIRFFVNEFTFMYKKICQNYEYIYQKVTFSFSGQHNCCNGGKDLYHRGEGEGGI